MGNDGFPIAIAVFIAAIVLGGIGMVAWIVSTVVNAGLTNP